MHFETVCPVIMDPLKTTKVDFFCIFWWRNNGVCFMKILYRSYYSVSGYANCSVLQQMKESDLFCYSVLEPSFSSVPQNLKKRCCFLFFMLSKLVMFLFCKASWHNLSNSDEWRKLSAAHIWKQRHEWTAETCCFYQFYFKAIDDEMSSIIFYVMKICYKNQNDWLRFFLLFFPHVSIFF